jgi:hypothetical protein
MMQPVSARSPSLTPETETHACVRGTSYGVRLLSCIFARSGFTRVLRLSCLCSVGTQVHRFELRKVLSSPLHLHPGARGPDQRSHGNPSFRLARPSQNATLLSICMACPTLLHACGWTLSSPSTPRCQSGVASRLSDPSPVNAPLYDAARSISVLPERRTSVWCRRSGRSPSYPAADVPRPTTRSAYPKSFGTLAGGNREARGSGSRRLMPSPAKMVCTPPPHPPHTS